MDMVSKHSRKTDQSCIRERLLLAALGEFDCFNALIRRSSYALAGNSCALGSHSYLLGSHSCALTNISRVLTGNNIRLSVLFIGKYFS